VDSFGVAKRFLGVRFPFFGGLAWLKNLFGLDFELGEDYLYDAAVVHPFLRSMARIRRALMVISHWTTHLDNIVIHTTLLLLLPKHLVDFVFSKRILSAFRIHRDHCVGILATPIVQS